MLGEWSTHDSHINTLHKAQISVIIKMIKGNHNNNNNNNTCYYHKYTTATKMLK